MFSMSCSSDMCFFQLMYSCWCRGVSRGYRMIWDDIMLFEYFLVGWLACWQYGSTSNTMLAACVSKNATKVFKKNIWTSGDVSNMSYMKTCFKQQHFVPKLFVRPTSFYDAVSFQYWISILSERYPLNVQNRVSILAIPVKRMTLSAWSTNNVARRTQFMQREQSYRQAIYLIQPDEVCQKGTSEKSNNTQNEKAPWVNGSIKWLLDGKNDYIRKEYIIIIHKLC